jgi:hypothetical protein
MRNKYQSKNTLTRLLFTEKCQKNIYLITVLTLQYQLFFSLYFDLKSIHLKKERVVYTIRVKFGYHFYLRIIFSDQFSKYHNRNKCKNEA